MRVRFGKKNLNVSSRRTRRVGETPSRATFAPSSPENTKPRTPPRTRTRPSETASILAFAFASSFAVLVSVPRAALEPAALDASFLAALDASFLAALDASFLRRPIDASLGVAPSAASPMAWSARPSRAGRAEAARRRPTRVHTRRLVSPGNWRTIARRVVRAPPSRVILRWHARYSCMILSHVTSGNPATATASSADPSNAPGAISTAASTTRSSSAASASRLWLVSTSANAVWKSTARVRSKRRTSHTRSADSHGRWLT